MTTTKLNSASCNNVFHGFKPVMLMVIVQVAFAGVNILYKLAVNDGMSLRVTVAYRFIFAAAFMIPFSLFVERKKRPKLTWMVLFQSFLCGLFGGALAQNLYLEALALTSATFASAMANLIPALTFIMAVCIGMERLNLGSAAGQAKIIGTITGIAGAMVLTFVKGPEIHTPTHVNLLHPKNNTTIAASNGGNGGGGNRRLLGSACALGGGICYALWLIIQTKMSERYPNYYSSTALMSLWAALLSTVFAVSVEKDWNQWKLGWNIRLLTVAYSGMVVSGMMVAVISWCVRMRGPLFASVFSPLMLVIIAIAGCTILNEQLHVGSIIGAVLIVCGLYAVLWGKSKEMKKTKKTTMSELPQCPHHDDDTVQVIVTRSNSKVEEEDGASNNSNNNAHQQDHNSTICSSNNVVRDNNQDSTEDHNNRGITRDEEKGEKENDDDEEGVTPNAEDIIPSVVI